MPLKTYETIGILNRYTSANIDGRDIPISFINGTEAPRLIQGRYTTDNKKIQDWLENSGGLNVRWRLVSSVPIPADKKVVQDMDVDDDLAKVPELPPTPIADQDDLATGKDMSIPEETDEDVMPEPEEILNEPVMRVVGDEVVNGQQARNYLMENFKDLTFRQVQNNAQIIAEAKARNVQFTQWEQFVTTK